MSKIIKYCKYGLYPGPIDEKMSKGAVAEIIMAVKKYVDKPIDSLDVLEVGSGRGYYAYEMSKHFKSVIGVDPYDEAFKSAQKLSNNKKGLEFKKILVENFKTKKKFDLIVALTVLEHMQNKKRSFKKIFSLLKDDGVIYITAPNKYWPFEQHYGLPFLSWLPLPIANIYLKVTKGVDSYEDCSYSTGYLEIKKFLSQFTTNFEFILPFDKESDYLNCGHKSPISSALRNIGIQLIKFNSLFWCVSKGFIVVAKK